MQQKLLPFILLSFCSFCFAEDIICKFKIAANNEKAEGILKVNLETGDMQAISNRGQSSPVMKGPFFRTTSTQMPIPLQKFSKESEFEAWSKMIDAHMPESDKAERGSIIELALMYNANILPLDFDVSRVTQIKRYYSYDILKPWTPNNGFARYYDSQGALVGQAGFMNFLPLVCQ